MIMHLIRNNNIHLYLYNCDSYCREENQFILTVLLHLVMFSRYINYALLFA